MPSQHDGYEDIAGTFMAQRSPTIGVRWVTEWARSLSPGTDVLDLGCGHGLPISRALADEGLHLFGIDASPTLVAAYRQNLPGSTVECSLAELSPFFHRSFGAAVAWGLLFLLSPDNQKRVIRNVGAALVAGDRFLFTAPHQAVTWEDSLTGQTSISLGRSTYHQLVAEAGMYVEDEADDDGGNHYYFARKLDPTIAAGPQTS